MQVLHSDVHILTLLIKGAFADWVRFVKSLDFLARRHWKKLTSRLDIDRDLYAFGQIGALARPSALPLPRQSLEIEAARRADRHLKRQAIDNDAATHPGSIFT
jgi:hypothetical protein